MPENTYRSSPLVSPDTVRQQLHLDKAFFDMHTKKNFGREDINGSQYVGTVENFGDEMLLESRKMKLLKPPLNEIICDSSLLNFFKLQYADEISSYHQTNMFVAVLKPEAFGCNIENVVHDPVTISYENAYYRAILRSENDSDIAEPYTDKQFDGTPVVNTMFVETEEPPIVTFRNGYTFTFKISLKSISNMKIRYGFFEDLLNASSIEYDPDDGDVHTRNVNVTLTETDIGLPCIWFCLEEYNTLPSVSMLYNEDYMGYPLLEYGSNNRGQTFLYPFAYGRGDNATTNLPFAPNDIPDGGAFWQIRVYARNHLFTYSDVTPYINMNLDIEAVEYVWFSGNYMDAPLLSHKIQFEKNEHVRVVLNPDLDWQFRTVHRGEYGYDALTYRNFIYAYLDHIQDIFNGNMYAGIVNTEDVPKYAKPLLRVLFNNNYYHTFEHEIANGVSGVHVDYSSDYSDHGVIKKYGNIYNFGDFDGLPNYYNVQYDRSVKRPHVEIYSIRDSINKPNHRIQNKQVAGLIIDGAIPSDKQLDTTFMRSDIKYVDYLTYETSLDITSSANIISDVALVPFDSDLYQDSNPQDGQYVFADITSQYPLYQPMKTNRFIYHGERTFSTGINDFDEITGVGRVYCISNDPVTYENNALANIPKPPRTLARICDIPTEFEQLIHIENQSPTFLFDDKYVHSDCDFTIDDQERIQELNRNDHNVSEIKSNGKYPYRKFIYDVDESYPTLNHLQNHYTRSTDLHKYLVLSHLNYVSDITDQDGEYNEDGVKFILVDYDPDLFFDKDIVSFYIKGQSMDFKINKSNTSFSLKPYGYFLNTIKIPFANLNDFEHNQSDGYDHTFTATSKISSSVIKIRMIISPEKWNEIRPWYNGALLKDLYVYKLDEDGFIWVSFYNEETGTWDISQQITGENLIYNQYDENVQSVVTAMGYEPDQFILPQLTPDHVIMCNMLSEYGTLGDYTFNIVRNEYLPHDQYGAFDQGAYDQMYNEIISTKGIIIGPTPDYSDYYEYELDLSEYIDQFGLNDDYYCYYFIHRVDATTRRIIPLHLIENHLNTISIFNKHHQMVVPYTRNRTNRFINLNENVYHYSQPELVLYNPYKTVYTDYVRVCGDLHTVEERYITFDDLAYENSTFEALNRTQNQLELGMALKENVYKFDLYKIPKREEYLQPLLINGDVSSLLYYIKMNFGENALPLLYKNTKYAFSRDKLCSYILENINNGVYPQRITNEDKYTRKLRSANDIVVTDSLRGYYVPKGEQPTGEYFSITRRVYHEQHSIESTDINAKPLFILRLKTPIRILDGFRMIDNITGNDISQYTLLVNGDQLYMFDTNNLCWVKIIRNT